MKIGLFFGSFNPVHNGHLMIANYAAEFTGLDEVWMVVSPHNPLKKKKSLLNDLDRYDMVEMAVKSYPRIKPSDIEFFLPKPSYTIDTLAYLKDRYPTWEFVILMGADGLETFHKWKNNEAIVANYTRYVYPRPGFNRTSIENHQNLVWIDAPLIEVSSTFIRDAIKAGKNPCFFLPPGVHEYILKKKFYF
jgi:nicotinate-nucleotide adenylyltransferase